MSLRGYVLAGGASARFGRDKAAVVGPSGLAMAVSVAGALRVVCSEVVLVRRTPEAPWEAPWGRLGVVAGVEGPDRHPLWGVAVAGAHAGDGRVLVAPCDLPWLDSEVVRAFVEGAAGGECVASDGERVHPLLAVLEASRAARAAQAAAEGVSVTAWVGDLPRVILPASALRNANRPADLDGP